MGPTYYSFPSLLFAQNGKDTQKLTNSFPQEEGGIPLNLVRVVLICSPTPYSNYMDGAS